MSTARVSSNLSSLLEDFGSQRELGITATTVSTALTVSSTLGFPPPGECGSIPTVYPLDYGIMEYITS